MLYLSLQENLLQFCPHRESVAYQSVNNFNHIQKEFTLLKVHLFLKDKDKEKQNMQAIYKIIQNDSAGTPKLALLIKQQGKGQIYDSLNSLLSSKIHTKIDISGFISDLLLVKQKDQLQYCQKAGKICVYFMNKLIKEVQNIIDQELKEKHCQISRKIQKFMESQTEKAKMQAKLKVDAKKAGFSFAPVIQSGGSYNFDLRTQPNKDILKSDNIVLTLATDYRQYISLCSRTLLIDSSQDLKKNYNKIQQLYQLLSNHLRPGAVLRDLYAIGVKFFKQNLPTLQIPQNFGSGIGLQLRQNHLVINQKCQKTIKPGMVFHLSVGVPNIPDGKNRSAVIISDTIIVSPEKQKNQLLTPIPKGLKQISYAFNNDTLPVQQPTGNSKRRPDAQISKNLSSRNEHQTMLKKKKLEQLKSRDIDFGDKKKKSATIDFQKHDTYKSKQDLPKDLKKNIISVDFKALSIILPICGQHVPFHAALLKNVSKIDQQKMVALRLNFHTSGTNTNISMPKSQGQSLFVKEITFRSQNIARMNQIFKKVKQLQKKLKQISTEEGIKDQLVQQEKLVLAKTKRPQLKELVIRPNLSSKKTIGFLDCHSNGFRYTTNRNQIVDIIFSNIKRAFFQPCSKEIIAAVHFNLKNPILINKKKVEDIQFYMQSGLGSEDIDAKRRDADDEEQDQERQKAKRRRIDKDIQVFCRACQQFSKNIFEFQMPDRQKGFLGTPYRSASLLQPTKNCLVNLIDQPFFVIETANIQIACFERMLVNARNIDLTFVFKDYENHIRIQSIPIDSVEKVKTWLDSKDIIFYQIQKNISWNSFLGDIRKGFAKFVEDGGWTAWDSDDQENGNNQEEEGDSQFKQEQYLSLQQSESQSQYSESGQSEDSSDSLSDKGLDSDEMDEEFQKMDRQKKQKQYEKESKAQKRK